MEAAKLIEWLMLCMAITMMAVFFIIGAKIVWLILTSKLDIRELIADPQGRLASKKMWSHVAAAVFTYACLKDASTGQPSVELLTAYMVAVGGFEALMKWMSMKQEKKSE